LLENNEMKKYILLLTVFSWSFLGAKIAYIIDWPGSIDECKGARTVNDLRCAYDAYCMKMALEKHGFGVHFVEHSSQISQADLIVSFDTSHIDVRDLARLSDAVKIMVTRESPFNMSTNFDQNYLKYFDYVGTWHDDFIDNKKFIKMYYPVAWPMIEDLVPFAQKKLCVIISRYLENFPLLYAERQQATDFFERFHADDYDFYGKDWESSQYKRYKTYKGFVAADKKIDCLKQYKFCICYENSRFPGYITEKIFDCFQAGCVPVYLGAPNVDQYIPSNCFISFTRFKNYKNLYRYLIGIDEKKYEEYLRNIGNFLQSEKGYFFTIDNYQKTCEKLVELAQWNIRI
jgi:hypothetical protein